MKFLSTLFAFIGALLKPKTSVVVADPVQTNNGTRQATTVSTTDADIAEADVQQAIVIVNNIRKALASPVAVLITDLIPGEIDNAIRETLVNELPVVSAGLTFASGILTGSDKSTQMNAILNRIKFSDNASLNAFYHALAAKVLMIVSGGKVNWSNAVMAVEYYFVHVFTQPVAAQNVAVAEAVAPAANPAV